LGTLEKGSRVNLEIDLIARYVERMLSNDAANHSVSPALQAGKSS
jgi:riboflavin synthase alpha subunit